MRLLFYFFIIYIAYIFLRNWFRRSINNSSQPNAYRAEPDTNKNSKPTASYKDVEEAKYIDVTKKD